MTVYGKNNVNLEAGSSTLDVNTGCFMMLIGLVNVNGSAGLLIFQGGQRKNVETSLISVLISNIG